VRLWIGKRTFAERKATISADNVTSGRL